MPLYGEPRLTIAARNGDLAQVDRILSAAAEAQSMGWFQFLFASPIDECATAENNSALKAAISSNSLEVVNRLLQIRKVANDALNEMASGNTLSVIDMVICYGNLRMLERFLELPGMEASLVTCLANADYAHSKFLYDTMSDDRLPILDRLLRIQVVANEVIKNNKALKSVITGGYVAALEILLRIPGMEAHVADDDNYLLGLAMECGHPEVVQRLLQIPDVQRLVYTSGQEVESLIQAAREAQVIRVELELDREQRRLEFMAAVRAYGGGANGRRAIARNPALMNAFRKATTLNAFLSHSFGSERDKDKALINGAIVKAIERQTEDAIQKQEIGMRCPISLECFDNDTSNILILVSKSGDQYTATLAIDNNLGDVTAYCRDVLKRNPITGNELLICHLIKEKFGDFLREINAEDQGLAAKRKKSRFQ